MRADSHGSAGILPAVTPASRRREASPAGSRRNGRLEGGAPLAILLFLAATAAQAQVVESIEVRVTSVDVVVTDRDGKPVTGLTKDDFELYENGAPQTITNFYAVERSATSATATAGKDADDAAGGPSPEQRKRRIVFFIDNESLEPARRNRFISVLDHEIARLVQPGDEATVIVWNHRVVAMQPFTSDVAALQASLREQSKRAGNSGLASAKSMLRSHVFKLVEAAKETPVLGMGFYNQALDVVTAWAEEVFAAKQRILNGLAATISRMAGVEGKKVLVFATGEMPEHTGIETYEWVEQIFRPVVPNIPIGQARIDSSSRSLTRDLQKLAREANADGVTMYLIDAAGALKTGMETKEEPITTIEFLERANTYNALQMIANITGGAALTGSDNFKSAIDTIVHDLDVYYSLGYRPAGDDEGDRHVTVKVKRPGLVVRSRRSWAPKSAVEQMEDRVIANVFHSGITGDFSIELTMRGEPEKTDRGLIMLPLRVTIPPTITLLPDGPDVAGGFSVYVVVGGQNGELSSVARTDHSIRVSAAQEKETRSTPYTWDVNLTVRPGPSTLSIAVVDRISNQTAFTRKIVNPGGTK